MSHIARCQCDMPYFSSLSLSLLGFSVSLLCSKYGLYLPVSVCVSQNCVAVAVALGSFPTNTNDGCERWNTFFVSMETGMICPSQKLVRCCDRVHLLHPHCLHSQLLKTGSQCDWKIHKIFHRLRHDFRISLAGPRHQCCLCLCLCLQGKQFDPTKRVLGIKKFKAIKSSHHNRHWAVTETNRRRPVISWEKDR